MNAVLIVIFAYGFVMGLFIATRRDAIWQFQTLRRQSRDLPPIDRSERWDNLMLGLGVTMMLVSGVLLIVLVG